VFPFSFPLSLPLAPEVTNMFWLVLYHTSMALLALFISYISPLSLSLSVLFCSVLAYSVMAFLSY
jgi:antibiotic biosynthesis monooxygenase (ABM) superfamily enzyme